MTSRLFDSNAVAVKVATAKDQRESVRRRAEQAEQVMREELELDDATIKLGERLQGDSMGVQAIHYKDFRLPGSKWMIEHAIAGRDYVYQLFPLRPTTADWRDTIALLITAMDSIFPRSTKIVYSPPNERFQIRFFTIKVENILDQPGWEDACQARCLRALAAVQA